MPAGDPTAQWNRQRGRAGQVWNERDGDDFKWEGNYQRLPPGKRDFRLCSPAADLAHRSFAYSALACCRMVMSGSTSLHRAKKSSKAVVPRELEIPRRGRKPSFGM